jgi:hypothetical protein
VSAVSSFSPALLHMPVLSIASALYVAPYTTRQLDKCLLKLPCTWRGVHMMSIIDSTYGDVVAARVPCGPPSAAPDAPCAARSVRRLGPLAGRERARARGGGSGLFRGGSVRGGS